MKKRKPITALAILAASLAVLVTGVMVVPDSLLGSSHREAPITALDTKADITDIYAFRSYDANGKDTNPPSITVILGVDPLLEPANGPNWFPFDPEIKYEIKVDNDNDGYADVIFEFRFQTRYQLPPLYTALAGFGTNPNGTNGVVPPQITDFSNKGLNLRQTYTVKMIKNGVGTQITNADGTPFFAVPANAGPRTIDYAALYQAGAYTKLDAAGLSVFAGTVDDPFFIDLGGTFDTANLRTGESGVPGVMTAAEDKTNGNFAADTVSGYAVNAIAIQVPIAMLTSTGKVEPPTSPNATIGVWGTTSRPRVTVRTVDLASSSAEPDWGVPYRQVQRLGNPLINELIIGIGSKDRWSMDRPANDKQFAHFDLDPLFVTVVDALYGVLVPGALFSPPAPRTDLLPLVLYLPPIAASGTKQGPIADLLRINTGVTPTAPGSANRLGLLAGDAAGFPNGRRLADDAVDITLRVAVGGVLAGNKCGASHNKPCNVFPNNVLGDGVNVNDVDTDLATDGVTNLVEPNTHFHTSFPYVDYCPSGRNRRHIDPGERGCVDGGAPIDCKVN
jgi:Domain of unknown function (DUF4331)